MAWRRTAKANACSPLCRATRYNPNLAKPWNVPTAPGAAGRIAPNAVAKTTTTYALGASSKPSDSPTKLYETTDAPHSAAESNTMTRT